MAGVLTFALGLETSAFGSALGTAATRLAGFLAVSEIVSKSVEKMQQTIEQFGNFADLSARTGESSKSLYQLGEAFKVAGIDAGAAPGMINRFNKSLSGVGEMGEKTEEAFAALGLSMDELKKKDAPAQFAAVATALSKLDKGSAIDIATRLFGREGAGNIMQITRDLAGFNKVLQESSSEGDLIGRVAPKFDALGDTVIRLGSKFDIMWAGAVEGMEPLIAGVLKFADTIPFQEIGEKFGNMFRTISAAFEQGKLGDLLMSTFEAGVEFFGNALFNTIGDGSFWDGIWDVMRGEFMIKWGSIAKSFMGLGSLLAASLDTAIQMAIESLSSLPGVGKLMGTENFHAKSFGENWEARKADAASSQQIISGWINSGMQSAADGGKKIGEAVSNGMTKAMDGPAQQRFKNILKGILPSDADMPNAISDSNSGTRSGAAVNQPVGGNIKPDASTLEKIGFMFAGGAGDSASKTEANTRLTADQLIKLNARNVDLINAVTGLNFSNS